MRIIKQPAGIAVLLLVIAAASCGNGEPEITSDTYAIILKENTAVRIDPMIFAGIVTTLGKGAAVQVLEKSREKGWVGRSSGHWYRIIAKDGSTGWVFAQNMTIHYSSDKKARDREVASFMDGELARIRQFLAGKWWSTNEFGDFTDHCIEMYDSGAYRSYMKGGEDRQLTGTYRINFIKNEIEFSGGTSFKSNLELAKRGGEYIIKKSMKDHELRFSKISMETGPEPEIKNAGAAGNGNTP